MNKWVKRIAALVVLLAIVLGITYWQGSKVSVSYQPMGEAVSYTHLDVYKRQDAMSLTEVLSLAVASILVNNYILVQFLGCCSFFGVSKKTDTAIGMGMAVVFVMALASAVSWAVWLSLIHI